MSILLDTPLTQPGLHGQPQATYGEIKITEVRLHLIGKRLAVVCEYGDTDGNGDWQPAPIQSAVHVVENDPGLFDTEGNELKPPDPAFDLLIVGAFPDNVNEPIYDGVARSLYQWLIDSGIYAGVVQ